MKILQETIKILRLKNDDFGATRCFDFNPFRHYYTAIAVIFRYVIDTCCLRRTCIYMPAIDRSLE